MSSQPAPAEPPTDQTAEDAQYYRRILHRLIDQGTEIADDIHQQATTPVAAGAPKPDLTAAFECIAQTIRRTILLARKVAEPIPTRAPAARPPTDRTAARKRIIREVEDAIQLKAPDQDAMKAEFLDRLDSHDLDEEIDIRNVPDIIKDIIRDLGLAHIKGTHPWKRRTPEDIEALRARAATPPRPDFRGSGVPDPPLNHSGLGQSP